MARPNSEVPARTDKEVDWANSETKPATGRGSNVPFCCGAVTVVVVAVLEFASCSCGCRCFSLVFAMVIFSGGAKWEDRRGRSYDHRCALRTRQHSKVQYSTVQDSTGVKARCINDVS